MSVVPNQATSHDETQFPAIAAFLSGTLDLSAFDHAAHVYIAWKLLQEDSLARATARFLEALKRLTVTQGIESKYHETISCFYMALIAERRTAQPGLTWAQFAESNRDLLGPAASLLEQYYSRDRLWSDLARTQFLLPDNSLQAGNDMTI